MFGKDLVERNILRKDNLVFLVVGRQFHYPLDLTGAENDVACPILDEVETVARGDDEALSRRIVEPGHVAFDLAPHEKAILELNNLFVPSLLAEDR